MQGTHTHKHTQTHTHTHKHRHTHTHALARARKHTRAPTMAADSKMAAIHAYEICSMARGKIKERFASASWEPSHALVHDVPDAEIFSLPSIVSIVAS